MYSLHIFLMKVATLTIKKFTHSFCKHILELNLKYILAYFGSIIYMIYNKKYKLFIIYNGITIFGIIT